MLSNLLIAFGTILFVWIIQYHWKRRRLYRIAAKHNGPTPLPLIGNALAFAGSNEEKLKNAMIMMASYESPVTVWLGQRLFFGITDAKHLETILNHPNALEKEELYQHAYPAIGHALLIAPVPLWKKHRKMIMPTFNQKILDGFVEIFSEQATILAKQLENKVRNEIDIFPYFGLFTLDAICETAMGISVNAQTTETPFVKWVGRCMEIMFNRMFVIWYHIDFIFNMTAMAKDFKEVTDNLRSFTKAIVTQKREAYQRQKLDRSEAQLEEVSLKRNTFLQQFIELSEEGVHLTDNEILDEVILIMIAGSETTASINSFTAMMLGMHPDIQEKVYMEVIDTIGHDRPVEYTDLPKLQYTEMVIKETMRLFPVGPLIVRAITGDIQLDENTTIPAGSSVVLCIIHAQRDPKVWPDPLRFDPLRFLPEECAKRNPGSYLPFSGGPRNCIGMKYAMMAMKTVVATLVRNYRIKSNCKNIADLKLKQDFVLKPIGGYGVILEKRT